MNRQVTREVLDLARQAHEVFMGTIVGAEAGFERDLGRQATIV